MQILLTSSSMYVMHTLHLHGRTSAAQPCRRVHLYHCVYVQPLSTVHASVGGSAWRHCGGVQRSSTQKDRAREKEGTGRKAEITYQKERRTESTGYRRHSLYRAHRLLIKSLLNRITALPFASHVVVIPKHRPQPSLVFQCLSRIAKFLR